MKDELQGKLVEILTSIQTAAGKASDFALSQLPDIAQSYVAYGRTVETVQMVLFLAMFAGALYVAVRYGFANTEAVETGVGYTTKGDWKGHRVGAAALGSLAALFTGLFIVVEMSSFAMVWIAPKVWLLKELAQMIR